MIWRGTGAAQPEQRRAGRARSACRAPAPSDDGVRPGRRRRRPGRPGRRRLRRLGGPRHGRARRASRPAARPAPRRGSRTTSASRPGISGAELAERARGPGREVRRPDQRPGRGDRRSQQRDGALRRAARATAASVAARAVVIATGARYRSLPVPRLERVRGRRASTTPRRWSRRACARATRSRSSAAATRPARRRCSSPRTRRAVRLIVREADLEREHVALPGRPDRSATPDIEVLLHSEVRELRRRATRSRRVVVEDSRTGEREPSSTPGRCSSSSAPSRTPVARQARSQLDDDGFVLTGPTPSGVATRRRRRR